MKEAKRAGSVGRLSASISGNTARTQQAQRRHGVRLHQNQTMPYAKNDAAQYRVDRFTPTRSLKHQHQGLPCRHSYICGDDVPRRREPRHINGASARTREQYRYKKRKPTARQAILKKQGAVITVTATAAARRVRGRGGITSESYGHSLNRQPRNFGHAAFGISLFQRQYG